MLAVRNCTGHQTGFPIPTLERLFMARDTALWIEHSVGIGESESRSFRLGNCAHPSP